MESYSYADAVRSALKQPYCLHDRSEKKPVFLNFSVSNIEKQINDKFPLPELKKIHDDSGSFWFSNEFPTPETLDFKNTINNLSKLSTNLRSRGVSIITGEGCLLSCLPELSQVCRMVFQVDHDPRLLHLSQQLIVSLPTVSIREETIWLDQAIKKIGHEVIEFYPARGEEIHTQYSDNRNGMGRYHCFSSEQRLKETQKACSLCKIIPVHADFFAKKDMLELAKIINKNNIEVVFINLSNVMEYFQAFYTENPFCGIVTGFDPSYHVRNLPLSKSTLCAFSSLRVTPLFTSVCCKKNYQKELYSLARKNSDAVIAQLAERFSSSSSTLLPADACLVLAKTAYPYSLTQASLRLTLSHLTYSEAVELQKQRSTIEAALKANRCIKGNVIIEFLTIIDTAITGQLTAEPNINRLSAPIPEINIR
ncbi:hypothetical protein [Endozoicomonas sp. SCSIO W0465]|uniref:hypothetical protein n=1 Tax=Endozoicomonas sp. SCSIO W0465 TaxID=2918516 RepID=UPI0020756FF0|nr:hypothetical protein [Endozoicomonas sp. SCSIO W0465]USE35561.1 hypothetical protein MJO57_26300 [Endozoicomonas sp. SCSIO W0465]